jgi:hypothetical protein
MLRKKVNGFLLLLIIAAPLFFTCALVVQKQVQQHNMLEALEHAALQTITVNTSSIKWIEKNREALVNGKLFDVKSYSINNNTITLIGLYDEREQDIINDLQKVLQEKEKKSSPLQQSLVKIFAIPFCIAAEVAYQHQQVFYQPRVLFSYTEATPMPHCTDIFRPPQL